jgi:hypothetical protein
LTTPHELAALAADDETPPRRHCHTDPRCDLAKVECACECYRCAHVRTLRSTPPPPRT